MRRWIVVILAAPALLVTAAHDDRDLFEEAERQYLAGSYQVALSRFQELVDQHPLSPYAADARFRSGVALVRLGRYSDAAPVLEALQGEAATVDRLRTAPFWLAIALFHQSELERSAALLRQLVAQPDIQRTNTEVYEQSLWYLARAQIAREQHDAAELPLRRLIGIGGSAADEVPVLLAFVLSKAGDHAAVVELARAYPPAAIGSAVLRNQYRAYHAHALWESGATDAAVALYQVLIEEPELEATVASATLRRLFIAARRRGDLQAMDRYTLAAETSLSTEPQLLADFWLRLGVDNAQRGNHDLADLFLDRVWARGGRGRTATVAALYLSDTRLALGADASGVLEEHLRRDPELPWLVDARLGDLAMAAGRFADAAGRYQTALKSLGAADPSAEDLAALEYPLAYALFRAGDLSRALDRVQEASARLGEAIAATASPAADLTRLRSLILAAQGRSSDALDASAAYLAQVPGDWAAQLDHLRLLYRERRWLELQSRADQLPVAGAPADAVVVARYLSGIAAVAQNRPTEALERLEAIDAGAADEAGLSLINPYVAYYRGWALLQLGRPDAAAAVLREAAQRLGPNEIADRIGVLQGEALFAAGSYRQALEPLAAVPASSPLAARAAYFRAKSYANAGQAADAIAAYRALLQTHRGDALAADAQFELAGVLAANGHAAAAEQAYQVVVDRYPVSPLREDAAFRRGEVLLAAGAPGAEQAFTDYRRRFPEGRLVDAALYWGGVAAARGGETYRAVLLWELLLERPPAMGVAVGGAEQFRGAARSDVAEIYIEQGDYAAALGHLQTLAQEAGQGAAARRARDRANEVRFLLSGLDAREADLAATIDREGGALTATGRQAMLALARIYVLQRDIPDPQALPMLDDLVGSETAETPQALFLTGELHRRRAEPVEAARAFLEVAAVDAGEPDLTATALVRAVEMLLQVGRRSDAVQIHARLAELFPNSEWEEQSRGLLAR